jgi:hypothetical protein
MAALELPAPVPEPPMLLAIPLPRNSANRVVIQVAQVPVEAVLAEAEVGSAVAVEDAAGVVALVVEAADEAAVNEAPVRLADNSATSADATSRFAARLLSLF